MIAFFRTSSLVAGLALFFSAGLASGQHPQTQTGAPASQAAIGKEAAIPDPGDFLDTDLPPLEKKAFEAYQAGHYQEAANLYLAALHGDIRNNNTIYNLACCYGLLGKADLAAKNLERAVKAGFDDLDHLQHDSDFDKVRDTPVFKETMDRLIKLLPAKSAEQGQMVLVTAPSMQPCRVFLPEKYDPEKSYRLIVGLHGYGANPDNFSRLWERFSKHDFIFAVPRAPYLCAAGKELGYSWRPAFAESDPRLPEAVRLTNEYVGAVIKELSKTYKVNEVYLLGFSQGGALSLTGGMANQALLKGVICFGGGLNLQRSTPQEFEAAKHLRVFIGHAKDDPVVGFENGKKASDYLKQNGYDVTFFEFTGGHRVPKEGIAQVEAWLEKP